MNGHIGAVIERLPLQERHLRGKALKRLSIRTYLSNNLPIAA